METQPTWEQLYQLGMSHVLSNPELAVQEFQKAAEEGHHPGAQAQFGYSLLIGRGVPKDEQLGVHFLREAASVNDPEACYYLGRLYEFGQSDVSQNFEEAARLYKISANQNHPGGLNGYGNCLQLGHGVEKDVQKGMEFIQKSADMGFARAFNTLGMCYQEGLGVAQNLETAARYFKMASDQKDVFGINNYALALMEGAGVPKDPVEGMRYLKMAAEMGEASSMFNYATFLKNEKEALQWYLKASKGGCKIAGLVLQNILPSTIYEIESVDS